MIRKTISAVAALAFMWGGMLLASLSASAAVVHRFEREIQGGETPAGFFVPFGLAVDDSAGPAAGDLRVADFANGVVDEFRSAIYQSQLTGPAGGSFLHPRGLTVDQSSGDIYVPDEGADVVDKFTATGVYICQITGRAVPSASECAGAKGSATPEGSLSEPTGVAVDESTDNVYVADKGHRVVDEFNAAGEYLAQLTSTPEHHFSVVYGVAVDNTCHFAGLSAADCAAFDPSDGDVYIADGGYGEVYKFDASGIYQSQLEFPGSSALQQLAVDQSNGDLYVTDKEDHVVEEFDSAGTLTSQINAGEAPSRSAEFEPYAVAVDFHTGKVYIGDAGNDVVDVFGPGLELPEAFTGPFSSLTPTSVTLNGEVNPRGSDTTSFFEYGPCAEPTCSASDPYVATQSAIQAETGPSPGSSDDGGGTINVPVEASVGGLVPNQAYHYQLIAESSVSRGVPGAEREFTTPALAPQAATLQPSFVGFEVAALSGSLNPEHSKTSYRFEYGPCETALECAESRYAHVTQTRRSSVYEVVVAFEEIETVPSHSYHYRLVAENSASVTYGDNVTFTTQPAPSLLVTTGPPSSVTETSAVISGTLHPQGIASSYGFQIGTQAGAYGPEIGIGRIGAGELDGIVVTLGLQNLQPGVTYHYRFLAGNAFSGTLYGADQTFTTMGVSSPLSQPLAPPLLASPSMAFPAEARVTVLTRTQRLARALRTCGRKPKRRRAACRRRARQRFGSRRR